MVHTNPRQVERLINRLDAPWTKFIVHVDQRVDINPFLSLLESKENVEFIKAPYREKGTWGDIGIVKATINALELAYIGRSNDYFILMSGQDYPLQKPKEIQSFFKTHRGKNYITSYSLPYPSWEKGGMHRIERYKINKSEKRGHFLFLPSIFEEDFYTKKTAGHINFMRKTGKIRDIGKIFIKRKFPQYLKPYAGSQWWALEGRTVEHVLHFIKDKPEYIEYHKYSLLPDEMFFQSIILSAEQQFSTEISKTYVNWERPSGPLPVTFGEHDFMELKRAAEEYLFARKFDASRDSEILDLIDQHLLH
ncbi:beta-1,6-N-acetylglucosaminyltransferase [Salinimicrobium sp. CAU 1759]